MTLEFQQLLRLAAIGATGHAVDMSGEEIDWNQAAELARVQRVSSYLVNALRTDKSLSCPDAILAPMIAKGRSLMISNAMHRTAIVQLLEAMEAAGIHAVLLKGYAIADCYAVPECRMSSDADVWVDPKDEECACDFMRAQGFSVEPRWKNGHHAVCHHPRLGCVELHVILYDEIVEEVWFGRMDGSEFVIEPHRRVESEDGRYYTLGYTDHFIFLALHMIKHFILSGLTLQMMLDVSLYFKKHAARIDADRVWKTIGSLKYDKLFSSVLWAMIRYCGFSAEDFPGICREAPEQTDAVLSDLEAGGWMGQSDKEAREEGWHEYNRRKLMKEKSALHYWAYMLRWKWAQYVSALFPSFEVLAKHYPYIRKNVLLTPYAWLHRLIFRGPQAVRRGALTRYIVTDEKKLSRQSQNRVSLFRELDML